MADGHCARTCRQANVQVDIRTAPRLPTHLWDSRSVNKSLQTIWPTNRYSLRSNVLGSCAEVRTRAMPGGAQSALPSAGNAEHRLKSKGAIHSLKPGVPFAGNARHRLKSKDSKYSLKPEIKVLAVGDSKYVLKPNTTGMALKEFRCLRRKRGVEALNAIPGYPDALKGPRYYLGMDFGTSGARAIVIDGEAPFF